MEKLKVIGTKEDAGLIGFDFFDVDCHKCGNAVYNIPICCASLCLFCKSVLIPCSICIDVTECKQAKRLIADYGKCCANWSFPEDFSEDSSSIK
jgi:hypothetical protein